MSKRNAKKETKRLGDQDDDIELRNTFDDPIKAGKDSSPYNVPKEDRAASPHAFVSDVDQQKLFTEIKSEVAALREELKSLAKKVDKLEKG
jgi:hypothetical protein